MNKQINKKIQLLFYNYSISSVHCTIFSYILVLGWPQFYQPQYKMSKLYQKDYLGHSLSFYTETPHLLFVAESWRPIYRIWI